MACNSVDGFSQSKFNSTNKQLVPVQPIRFEAGSKDGFRRAFLAMTTCNRRHFISKIPEKKTQNTPSP